MTWKGVAGRVGASAAGMLWGFFGALNVVFSDSGSRAQLLQAVVLVVGVYLVLGFVAGLAGPASRWRWGLWLAIPAAVLLTVYSMLEPSAILLSALVATGAVIAACLGGEIGSLARRRAKRS